MDKLILENYINRGFSTHEIAAHTKKSQTNIRYWLKKFDLKTNLSLAYNNVNCLVCNNPLTNKQVKFCSSQCKYRTDLYKQKNYTAQQRRGHQRKIDLVNLAGGKCQRCGYDKNYSALQFHHINPTDKDGSLDVRLLSTNSWEWCLNEFKKCQLLCSNCHAEHHNPHFNRNEKEQTESGGTGGI